MLIGCAQIAALAPGISRSGATMTAGLLRGLDHEDAARFSFLLATPVILAAGVLKLPDLFGPLGRRHPRAGPGRQPPVRGRRLPLGPLPHPVLRGPLAAAVRRLLPRRRARLPRLVPGPMTGSMTTLALNPLERHRACSTSFGALGVLVVLFAETGLLIGFFLPGDSLLVTAGLLAATSATDRSTSTSRGPGRRRPVPSLGGQVGYLIGRKAGPPLLARQRNRRLRAGRSAPRSSCSGTATAGRWSSPASFRSCGRC